MCRGLGGYYFFGWFFYCIFVRFGKMTHLVNLKMCRGSSPGCPGGCGAPEKVWVLVYSWSLYIQTRNIQGLTPFQNVLEKCQIWKGVSSCMFLQLMSFGQEHTRTYTFSRFFENRVTSSGVSPCMFHVCIYKNQEHTRSHTFSKNHENFLKTYKNSHLFNSFHFNQTTIKLFVDGTP